MRLYEVVKVFDLSGAPQDLRESYDLAVLRPQPDQDGTTILALKVGHYETACDDPLHGSSTREITYIEYRLHRWLLEEGALEGEDVFLRWKQDCPGRPIYVDGWRKTVPAQPGSVTVLRNPSRSCK